MNKLSFLFLLCLVARLKCIRILNNYIRSPSDPFPVRYINKISDLYNHKRNTTTTNEATGCYKNLITNTTDIKIRKATIVTITAASAASVAATSDRLTYFQTMTAGAISRTMAQTLM